jgi:hypothetical protein
MWVVKSGCARLLQILNTHIAGGDSATAARRPENRGKNRDDFATRFTPRAKMEPNHGKFVNRCDRSLKLKRIRAR